MKNTAFLALVVLSAAPAAASERSFPGPQDSWRFDVQAPAGPGRTRTASVDASPLGAGRWAVRVACGEHETRTGREVLRVEADGVAEQGRMAAIGGTIALGGRPSSFLIDLGDDPDALRLRATFTDPRCASGWGDLSAGD